MVASGQLLLMAIYMAVVCCGSGPVNGQEKASATDLPSLVAKGDEQAKQMCERSIGSLRGFLDQMGTIADFREYATGMIDLSEKLAQGQDLFGSNNSSRSRLTVLFREKIYDDRTLPARLQEQYEKLQLELLGETFRICRAGGCSDDEIDATISFWVIPDDAFSGAYDGLITKADRLSKSDWIRGVATWVGSDVASRVIEGAAKETGVWPEQGGWADSIAGWITQFAVARVIEEVTDPVGDIARSLHTEYQAINRHIMDSPGGFAAACRKLAEHHVQGRHRLLRIPVKEVK